MPAAKKTTQSAIARHWKCSQQYVAKLVRKGMPTNSIAAAEKWRDDKSQRGVVGAQTTSAKAAPIEPLADDDGRVSMSFDEATDNGALVAEVMQLRKIVAQFRQAIACAKTLNERSHATKDYTAVLNTLRQFEKELPEILKAQRSVVEIVQVERAFGAIYAATVKHFRDLPARLGDVPLDEDDRYKLIEKEVEKIIAGLRVEILDEVLLQHQNEDSEC